MRLQFRVLGPLEVYRDAEIVPLRGALQRRLLSILLLRPGEVVDRDRLADELWSGEPPATATTALQVQVSRLRAALEPGRSAREEATTVVTRPAGYVLAAEREHVDAFAFEDLVGRSRATLAGGRLEEAIALAESALGQWRGAPLPDLADHPVARAAVARWEELRASAEEERIEAELALGRHAAVVAELEALVRAEPLRERRTGQLMVALYRSGRQADALRAFAALRETLVTELGVEPGPELRALERGVLAHDLPDATGAGSSAPAPRRGPGDQAWVARASPFVGREVELAQATEAMHAALAGDSQVLLVSGEAGIGKTRLAEELASAAAALGAPVWWGRCYEDEAAPAYWPWVQVLRAARAELGTATFLAGLGPEAAVVAQVLPEAALPARSAGAPPTSPEEARVRLFDAFAAVVGRLAASSTPVMVVLDDLHRADLATLRLLRFIVGQLPEQRPRLFLVGLYRDLDAGPELAGVVGDLARETCVTRAHLTGLRLDDVAQLVAGAGGRDSLGGTIHGKTAGNPFYVRELLRLLESEGRLVDLVADDDLGVPTTVREVVASRTQRLGDGARRSLSVAAVAGARFDVGVVERVTEVSTDEVLDSLEEAAAAGLIVEDVVAPGAFRFSHDIVRETLYRELSMRRRCHLHGRVGRALAELRCSAGEEVQAADLAHHFGRAAVAPGEDPLAAVHWCEAAAADATRALAYEEAVLHHERAVTAEASCPPDPDRRCRLLLALGEARWRSGEVVRAREALLDAAAAAREAGRADVLADAVLAFGGGPYRDWRAMRSAFGGQMVELLEEALAAVGSAPSLRRVALLGRLAEELYYTDRDRRLALSEQALDLGRRLGDTRALVPALCSRCSAIWDPDHVEERRALSAEIVMRAEEVGSRELGLFGRHYLYVAQVELGDAEGSRTSLDEFESLARELRQPLYLWEAAWIRAMEAIAAGRIDEGDRLAHEAFEIGQRASDPDAFGIFGTQIGSVRLEQDRTAEMEPFVRSFLAEDADVPAWQAGLCLLLAEIGPADEAREVLAELAATGFDAFPVDFVRVASLAMTAHACSLLGEGDPAATLHALLLPYAGRTVLLGDRTCLGAVAHYLGLTAATAGRVDEADEWFAAALAHNERMGLHMWAAHTRYEWARALTTRGAQGDAGRAAELRDRAASDASALGLTRLTRLLAEATEGA